MATVHRGAFIWADSARRQRGAHRRLLKELHHYLEKAGFKPRALLDRSVWVRGQDRVRIEVCKHHPGPGAKPQVEVRLYFDSALRDDKRFRPVLAWIRALHAHHYR